MKTTGALEIVPGAAGFEDGSRRLAYKERPALTGLAELSEAMIEKKSCFSETVDHQKVLRIEVKNQSAKPTEFSGSAILDALPRAEAAALRVTGVIPHPTQGRICYLEQPRFYLKAYCHPLNLSRDSSANLLI